MTLSENYLGQGTISGEGLQRDAAYKISCQENSRTTTANATDATCSKCLVRSKVWRRF